MHTVATDGRSAQTAEPENGSLHARFDDMEDLAAVIRCDLTQVAPGGAADVTNLALPSVEVARFRSSFDLIARGTRPAGLVTFILTDQSPLGLALNGHRGGSDSLWAYGPGAEVYGVTPRLSGLTLITVPDIRLDAKASPGDGALGPRCRTLRPAAGVRTAVSRTLAAAFDLARRDPEAFHDQRRRLHIENDFVEQLSMALHSEQASPGSRNRPALVSRPFVLRAVDDLLDARRGEPVRVTELSAFCGVSLRTLHNTFQAAHGVSAMEYARLHRLNAVRRMLARADPDETTVSELALSWGFWHPGAFSVLYRKTFGERPSETLRRRR